MIKLKYKDLNFPTDFQTIDLKNEHLKYLEKIKKKLLLLNLE